MQLTLFIIAAVALVGNLALAGDFTSANLTARAPSTWIHPGVLLNKKQLDFIRSKVNAGQEPWSTAYKSMMSSDLASESRQPTPYTVVECGSYSQNPGNGCKPEREDALAAYANALAWYITQNSKYAKKSITYFNAWSYQIKDHTYVNGPLQTGWSGTTWARAAEIIRYTYTGWASSDITQFKNMLKNVYLPKIIGGKQTNGNWELVMMEAAQGISIFLEDKASYDKAMSKFMTRVPAYIYLTSDGALPKVAPGSGLDTKSEIVKFWNGQPTFVNGLAQETCRDFTHTGYGLSSISHVAETSRIQGNDLYTGEIGERLRNALIFHSMYELSNGAQPSWLCPGKTWIKGLGPITEVGFNALHTRLGKATGDTEALTTSQRPAGTNRLFVGWETLTHAGNTA